MPENVKFYFISFVIALLLLGLFILLLATLYSKKQEKNKNDKIKMQTEFQHELYQTQIEIHEQTLKNISQEIHDNIGQVLSLAKLNLHTLKSSEEDKLNDTRQLVSKALNDLRNLSRSMHGDRIAELGLQESIENELQILQNTGQFNTNLSITGQRIKIEPQREMVLFRILQESLSNMVKHSNASNIHVSIDYQPSFFSLTVKDDGAGFSPEALRPSKAGVGLKSMQNRAALIGGAFSINSKPGEGTIVKVTLNL